MKYQSVLQDAVENSSAVLVISGNNYFSGKIFHVGDFVWPFFIGFLYRQILLISFSIYRVT